MFRLIIITHALAPAHSKESGIGGTVRTTLDKRKLLQNR